jgi:hypothetical protein
MTPAQLINFGARFEYLSAIEAHWPDVLQSLNRDVFPGYHICWERNPPSTALQTLAGLSKASAGSAEFGEVERAVRKWAEAHGIRDEWIWDAAVQTMQSWAHQERISKWTYLAAELGTPRFQPQFGFWIPFFMRWREFKRTTDERYRRELANYHTSVGTLWGQRQPKLSQQAVWTVLWQRGKSPEAIRSRHLRTTGKTVSLPNIQRSVHAFATAAGVSLRPAKAGRRANITSM